MLDVGKHCAYCRQLDFLPFHCSFCNEDFCSNHRLKEDHHCRWLLEHEEV
nr:Chain A, CDC48-associated ubiquitin-like/zinc finger protein 1 [Saccharomyces cerevisiae S288C]